MCRILYLKIFSALFIIALFAQSSLAGAGEDPCREKGISVRNLTSINLWYKRDGGDCSIWQQNKIFVIKPEESIDIFSDLICKTKYCIETLLYEDYKSFDNDENCRVKILPGCKLSDM